MHCQHRDGRTGFDGEPEGDFTAFDLAAWRKASAGVGNTFDGKSQAISGPPPDKIAVIPNDYEPGRAHLVIYNWSKSASLDADLSAAVAAGSQFQVLIAKEPYGVAVVSGTYQKPVAIPLARKEMEVFLILSTP